MQEPGGSALCGIAGGIEGIWARGPISPRGDSVSFIYGTKVSTEREADKTQFSSKVEIRDHPENNYVNYQQCPNQDNDTLFIFDLHSHKSDQPNKRKGG